MITKHLQLQWASPNLFVLKTFWRSLGLSKVRIACQYLQTVILQTWFRYAKDILNFALENGVKGNYN